MKKYVLCIIVLLCVCGCDTDVGQNTKQPDVGQTEIYNVEHIQKIAKNYLLASLKCPTTAKIDIISSQQNGRGYLIGGKVTSVNSFNAPITQTWIVMLDYFYKPVMLMIDDEIYVAE